MFDFESYPEGRLDWPVSTVRSHSSVKSELARKLDAFERLELSAQDRGFLQLAQAMLGEGAAGSSSRPGAAWGDGLIS
jgi:hypothetical protein